MLAMKDVGAIRRAISRFRLRIIDWESLNGEYHVEVSREGRPKRNRRILVLSASDYRELRESGVLRYQKNASAIQGARYRTMLAEAV